MGCGCKNKANQAQTKQAPQAAQQPAQSNVKQVNVQESVKKIVQKYYRNK